MPLEGASYINGLVSTNPVATDGVDKGDDHIRLIKAVLKATFPNITGPVTVDQNRINNGCVPQGLVAIWSGSIASIPTGWALCDGGTYAKEDGSGNFVAPDLRDKFVLGAGTTAVDATGGAWAGGNIATSSAGAHTHGALTGAGGDHNHGAATGGTALTTAQLPAHQHFIANSDDDTTPGALTNTEYLAADGSYGDNDNYSLDGTATVASVGLTSSVGSGATHNHSISSSGTHTHSISSDGAHTHTVTPPYLAKAYIVRK